MRKNSGILAMMAAMMGMGNSAQATTNSVKEYKSRPGLSDAPKKLFPPDYGITPRQYGTYIATRQSNIVKSKRRSKVAFG